MANILRRQAAWKKFGVGRTTFLNNYVQHKGGDKLIPGTQVERLKPVPLGERAVGFFDDEVDAVMEALRAARDGKLSNTTA